MTAGVDQPHDLAFPGRPCGPQEAGAVLRHITIVPVIPSAGIGPPAEFRIILLTGLARSFRFEDLLNFGDNNLIFLALVPEIHAVLAPIQMLKRMLRAASVAKRQDSASKARRITKLCAHSTIEVAVIPHQAAVVRQRSRST